MARATSTTAVMLLLGLAATFQSGNAEEPMMSTDEGTIIISPSENKTVKLESDFYFEDAEGSTVWSETLLEDQKMCKRNIAALGDDIAALGDDIDDAESKCDKAVAGAESKCDKAVAGAESKCDKAVAGVESKCEDAVADLQSQVDLLKKLLKPCPAGQFSVKEPTASTDRQCKPHSAPCTGATYEKVAPTPTNDRECDALDLDATCASGTWLVFKATPFSPLRCAEYTKCSSSQYETKASTPTSDRECKDLTACQLGKTYQTKAPTSTSDRICGNVRAACASGEKETPPTLTSNRVCEAPVDLTSGCKKGIRFAKKVNDYIWLCSDGAVTNKGYDRMGQQCNNAGSWYLAGTRIHTALGRPSANDWSAAATYMRQQGHDYIMTGQPARSCAWGSWTSGFSCNGLGYVHTSDSVTSGNWNSLVDGNGADRRSWPAANSPRSHRMPSMCVSASHIPGAYLYGKYIWRHDPSKGQGCKTGAAFSQQITPLMWLCSDGAVSSKGYDRIGQQCNNDGKFYLAGVKIHTKLGKPPSSAWSSAANFMRSRGHSYFITGQPTRSCTWASWTGGFNCNGLGYIGGSDSITSGNWNSLVDGNGAERRSWPSANSPNVLTLASLCVKADHIPGAYLFGKYIWRLGAVSSGGAGCKSGISHAKKVNDNMWLCSDGAVSNKGYDRIGQQCNNAGKFYLAGVKIHTKLGRPTQSAWSDAALYMRQNGHDFAVTGQPARGCTWSSWTGGFNCNGLGYVSTGDSITSSNWNSLVDGNGAERRSWPSANSPNVHKLASICVKADQVPGAYLYGKYIWRLGAVANAGPGCRSGIQFAKKVNDNMWLCSDGAVTNKGYDRVGQACNNGGKFYLGDVKVHTKLGRPDNAAWVAAASFMRQNGHDYIITGQATRSCSWTSWQSNFNCNGLGYINSGENTSGSNWNSLLDNNNNERRSWPAANSPTSHKLASLCVKADQIGATLYGKYIWRL